MRQHPTSCSGVPDSSAEMGRWALLTVAFFALAALNTGCTFDKRRSGPGPEANAHDDTGGGNIGDIDDATGDTATADAGSTDTGSSDAATPDAGHCPGGLGCPCADESQCGTGMVCADAGDGKRCAAACGPDSPCPSGEVCVTPEPGKSPVCVPATGRVCDPCTTTQQCLHAATPNARCADHGPLGFFCRDTCGDNGACAAGQQCMTLPIIEGGTAKFCVDVASSGGSPEKPKIVDCTCSKLAIEGKLATTCRVNAVDSSGAVIASCAGKRFCGPNGLTACDAKTPADETCNGIDDDCNSKIDDGDGASCDDDDPCTIDSCGGKAGCQNKTIPDGTACDDGDPCTFGDICGVGTCKGVDKACDDGIACTVDTCNADDGKCLATPAQFGDCSDGNPCTLNDFCLGGACKSGPFKDCADNDICTSDGCDSEGKCFNKPDLGCSALCKSDKDCGASGNPCVQNACDLKSGKCAATKLSGKACDDGDKCTLGDACVSGQCTPGKALPGGCDDGNACTADLCDSGSGKCTHKANPAGAPCSTGNACGKATCDATGQCVGDKGKSCDDNDPCTKDSCEPSTGKCVHDPLGAGAACDDGNPCTANDACAITGAGATCEGKSTACDDNNACTADVCTVLSGKATCAYKPAAEGDPCDDGDACTSGDACTTGSCKGAAKTCDDGKPCTKDSCDAKSGTCIHADLSDGCDDGNPCTTGETCKDGLCGGGTNVDCNDDKPCTADSCNPKAAGNSSACVNAPIKGCGDECGNNEPCPEPGGCLFASCVAGKCTTKPKNDGMACGDGDKCTGGAPVCKKGQCVPGSKLDCNDDNVCTTDSCDPKSGCVNKPVGTAAKCDDGDSCTSKDTCKNGSCDGAAINCDDNNPCSADTCDKKTGCVHGAKAGACDDGDDCTVGDTCSDKKCKAGALKACIDNNPCTDDGCDPKTGKCAHPPNTATCNDNDVCTTGDRCKDGSCAGGGKNLCNDNNGCTTDTCEATKGCVHAPTTDPCNDNNPCTTGDRCSVSKCVGKALVCDDNNACTADACDPKKGCVTKPTTANCDDGDVCTVSDVCSGGACKGKPRVCDDKNPCTNDACVAASGDNKGGCVAVPNTLPCDDGNVCTISDVCASGACKPGVARVCNDNNPCTTDSCDPKSTGGNGTGCTAANNTAKCDDGNTCTSNDACAAGKCTGAAVKCDDGNLCTNDTCDAKLGCQALHNTAACDDGDPCSLNDKCAGGKCAPGSPKPCNDGNPCTTDSCTKGKGCTATPSTGACDDGNKCTPTDTCSGGKCVGSGATKCDDGNPCTTDTCDAKAGCIATNNTATCSDNNACTQNDVCSGGSCVGKPQNCQDGNPCTHNGCKKQSGCTTEPNTANCNDGNACTTTDKCSGGKCVGTGAKNCNDGNPCTTDSCNKASGCAHSNNTNACDDGSKCTLTDRCSAGKCVGTGAPKCDDGNLCTTDSCDAKKGCVAANNTAPCNDGDTCTATDRCSGGTCVGTGAKNCNDGNPCTTDTCDKTKGCVTTNNTATCDDGDKCTPTDKCGAGKCVGSGTTTCNDGNPCTTDSCDKIKGCVATNNTATCSDNNACTQNDACSGGTCVGKPQNCQDGNPCTHNGCKKATGCTTEPNTATCNDGNPCTTTDTCNQGKCVGSGAPNCDDGNPCTIDSCKNPGGCAHTNNSAGCNDGNACTSGDTCATGKCVGKPVTCNDNNACTKDSCDTTKGCVFTDTSAACNDNNPCTTDSCNAQSSGGKPAGCVNANNTGACNDGDACTASDTCSAGKCGGSKVICNDNNPCTDDGCNSKTGCTVANNSAKCDDGDVCTGGDQCSGGGCKGNPNKACDDGNVCTTDSCDPKGGCVNANNAAACDDGNKCTGSDTCSGGKCGGTAITCNDNNACTTDSCNSATGCVFTNNTAACNDGDDCTDKDACSAGKCSGQPKVCNDNNACTTDACEKGKGCVFTADTKKCDDGNVCTDDVCSPTAGCTHINNAKVCDVGNVCTGAGVCSAGNCLTSKGIFVETVAGSSAGFADGTKSNARFNRATGIALFGQDTFVVADQFNHRIRRVTSAGAVTTIAGSGNPGLLNANGKSAMFNRPYDVAADQDGMIYVADQLNSVIRKIDDKGNVTTFAGTGVQGNNDGNTLTARFRRPLGVATTRAGGVFVADTSNHRIRRVAHGQVVTLSGTSSGFRDGPGSVARFSFPRGLDVDSHGVIFVADTNNQRIRRVESNGQTSTIAGNGQQGFSDGGALTARFRYPWDVAVDAAGQVWVGDRSNTKIRKIAGGIVTTFAGSTWGYTDGNALSARFTYPAGIAVDETGLLYIADEYNHRVRRVRNTQQACSVGNRCYAIGMPDPAKPCQVCDPGQNAGGFTALSNGDDCSDGSLCTTDDVCASGSCKGNAEDCDDQDKCTTDSCDAKLGGCLHDPIVGCDGNCKQNDHCDDSNDCTIDLCVNNKCSNAPTGDPCDDGNQCTLGDVCSGGKCAAGNVVMVGTVAGSGSGYQDGPASSAKFDNPFDVVIGNDNAAYVADFNNHRIRRIDPGGVVTTFAGSGNGGLADGTGTQAWLNRPMSIDVHRNSGDLYVADTNNHAIRRITKSGVVTTVAGKGTPGSNDGQGTAAAFRTPRGIAVTPGRSIYIGDYFNNRIRLISPSGAVTRVAGSTYGFQDGAATVARFRRPAEVALDLAGNLFICDRENHRIRRLTPTRIVTTVAGTGNQGNTDGATGNASFRFPWGLIVDSANRIFVADRSNMRIRMIDKGFVFTIAGVNSSTYKDGPGPAARFSYPVGMGLTPNGVVVVADQFNHRIRSITLSKNACRIENQCWSEQLQNPGNACQVCDGAKNATNWTARANGASCQDGQYCSINDACTNGKCGGTTLTCNDGNACTKDFCDGGTGACVFQPIPGCS